MKSKYVGLICLALLVAVFSFPEMGLDYGTSVDQSLKWLFNYLFSNDLSQGRNIIFPHGPLAFFMYPTGENFVFSAIVTVLLQVVFFFQLYFLLGKEKWQYMFITALLSWFIFSLSNFNLLILSNISVAYLNFLNSEKPVYKYIGFVLTAFAFYVKAYVAILAGMLTFSFLVIVFLRKRNIKQGIIDLSALLASMLFFWLLMYHQLSGFFNYCLGMIHLAGDNSAGAALHPNNNWLLIIPFLVVIVLLPFLQKSKEGVTFGFLFLLSFFAAWKYGMAREDYHHVKIFLFFVVISMILFLIYNRKKLPVNISLIVIVFVLFAFNLKNLDLPQSLSINYSGISNFMKFTTSFSEIKEMKEKQNLEVIAINRLPKPVRDQIGEATVDIYPYDLTIIAANGLNWKPRPIIQSYVTYTSWLDKKNADHFRSAEAPQFFIFKLNNNSQDMNGGTLESIDNRYLLNDEPNTLIELIRNYQPMYADNKFMVYSRRSQKMDINSILTKTSQGKWHQWISVPDTVSQVKRLKIHVERSLAGDVKSFLYKDELYYLYLKTQDGTTLKYRIVPQNAADGLWISPFLTSAADQAPVEIITQVMLTCSDKNMVNDTFSYEWEYLNTEKKEVYHFFGKDSVNVKEVYLDESIDFTAQKPNWHGFNTENVLEDSISRQKYYRLEPQGYSPTLKINSDSVSALTTRISVDCWLKARKHTPSSIVIETENAAGEKNWHGMGIHRQIFDEQEINHVFSYVDLSAPVAKVTVYLWNNDDKPVSIYSMQVKMIKL
ncbi:MAG TPA: hypothetical protein VFG54_13040 [Prolixibacteraceae bacterium]|nr:hypothetical protein [Prolixibacteraceae bacterium]